MDLSMPLSYRIASMPSAVALAASRAYGPSDYMRKRCEAETTMIARSTKIRLDNVAEFYAQHSRDVWDAAEDVPNWAPTHEHFFAEWSEPETWNISGKTVKADLQSQTGFFVMSLPVGRMKGAGGGMADAVQALSGGRLDGEIVARLSADAGAAEWILFCSQWTASNSDGLRGRPMLLGLFFILPVAADGRLLGRYLTGPSVAAALEDCGPDGDVLWSPINVLGLGLSFCHCKNVAVREAPERRPNNWHANTGVPVFTYRTLDITPMREVLRSEGRSDSVGAARAMHICRGHFANYAEDRPLFGREGLHGQFWIPQHVRGDIRHGAVVKDYTVSN